MSHTKTNYSSNVVLLIFHLKFLTLISPQLFQVNAYPLAPEKKTQPPTYISNLEITMNTHWSEWSDCSKCGQVGKQIRKGICYVTEINDFSQTNRTANEKIIPLHKRKRGNIIHN